MLFLLFKPKILTHPLVWITCHHLHEASGDSSCISSDSFSSPLGSRGTLFVSILCYFVVHNTISHHISSSAFEFVEDFTDFTEKLKPSSLIWVGPAMSLSLANDFQVKMTCHSQAKALFASAYLQSFSAFLNPEHCPKTEVHRAILSWTGRAIFMEP